MKITVGQFKVKSKDVKHNFLEMKKLINLAKSENFEVIVFGQYSLSGYGCGDLFKSADFINEVNLYQNKLKELASDIVIIFGGLIKKESKLYSSAIIYNSNQALYSFKESLSKRELNEPRYFSRGANQVIEILDKQVLVTFSEDLNNISAYTYDHLIILASDPYNKTLKVSSNKLLVYANTIGISASYKAVFINGGSSYIKAGNKILALNNPLAEGLISKENKLAKPSLLAAIVSGIKDFSDQTFGSGKKWIVGSSGGLDSAVTVALLAIALGSEQVLTYNLASKYNKDLTKNNARLLSKKLNIKHYENSIEDLLAQNYKTLANFGYREISGFNEENIQARSRGHLLSAFSAIENAIICNNGNKLELVLGYATLYGDTIGALSPIGDLTKVEVFDLAKEINEFCQAEVIPINLLPQVDNYTLSWDMPPSAELSKDQVDPMKWYYHDLLLDLILTTSAEKILENYLDNQFENLELGKWLDYYNLRKGEAFLKDFSWFYTTMQINSFKRLQTPPVLAISNQVIGIDYIETPNVLSKSEYYLSLEKAILKKYP